MQVALKQYQVKLAETEEERLGAQRLRYRVFVEEMGAAVSEAARTARLEQDAFDPYFDHLILTAGPRSPIRSTGWWASTG